MMRLFQKSANTARGRRDERAAESIGLTSTRSSTEDLGAMNMMRNAARPINRSCLPQDQQDRLEKIENRRRQDEELYPGVLGRRLSQDIAATFRASVRRWRGRRSWGMGWVGPDPLKICRRVRICFDPLKCHVLSLKTVVRQCYIS